MKHNVLLTITSLLLILLGTFHLTDDNEIPSIHPLCRTVCVFRHCALVEYADVGLRQAAVALAAAQWNLAGTRATQTMAAGGAEAAPATERHRREFETCDRKVKAK
ncbi:MAG TPA: hypothetical protein PLD20_04095 [Blastocatellia bacterium]|nr:hypothetical protein [Blastocatellia bacterium]HMX25904.1 hypothetical protein [Blastocatellia bacterium]HMY72940.1 hypothetical protein [Blastocatellia bacterium]HMZ17086.1 hypothetical protein [Blastocatellia bacterium]HNG32367.1 hypothetical protein [Blastocatellia bacterium]